MPRSTSTTPAAPGDPFAQPVGGNTKDEGVRRDRYGRYMIPAPPEGDDPAAGGGPRDIPWTRATTMAKTIADTFALNQWGKRMVAKGLALRPDLRALVAATPFEDRDTLNKACQDAEDAAGSKVSANLGTARHALTELLDRGHQLPPLEEAEEKDLSAYSKALSDAGIEILPDWIERTVVVPEFGVAGTLDRIVRMPDGTLRIADLKTGADLSYGWGEISIQEYIYAAADWAYDWPTGDWLRMPEVSRTLGLVIHLPVGKGQATLYDVNLRQGKAGLELAYGVREWRKGKAFAQARSTAVAELTPSGVLPATAAPLSPLQRVMAATNKAALAKLWDELTAGGTNPSAWTPELNAAAQGQMTKFATT